MTIGGDSELPDNAWSTWQAYQAMVDSKTEHFSFFRSLNEKYKKYGQPSAQENARLDKLLQSHDARVRQFKRRLNELKISDPHAYGLLVRKLSQQTASADSHE